MGEDPTHIIPLDPIHHPAARGVFFCQNPATPARPHHQQHPEAPPTDAAQRHASPKKHARQRAPMPDKHRGAAHTAPSPPPTAWREHTHPHTRTPSIRQGHGIPPTDATSRHQTPPAHKHATHRPRTHSTRSSACRAPKAPGALPRAHRPAPGCRPRQHATTQSDVATNKKPRTRRGWMNIRLASLLPTPTAP